MPYIHLTKDKDIQNYLSSNDAINSDLSNEQEFLKTQISSNIKRLQFKAVLFVYDKTQIPNIMNDWIEATYILASRNDIRLGYVGDRARAQYFINKNREKYNLGVVENFILLLNYQHEESIPAFLELKRNMNIGIAEWINLNSADVVHEIKSQLDSKLIDMIEAPKITLFIDESQQSRFVFNHLHKLAGLYKNQLCFTFVQDPQLKEIKHELGVFGSDDPTIGIFTNQGVIYPFRYDKLTIENLEEYLKNFSLGRLRPFNNDKFHRTIDDQIYQFLKNTKHLNIKQFEDEVLNDSTKDCLIYFYSSQKNSFILRKSIEYASNFDATAQRFKEHQLDTVMVGSYDTYRFGVPDIMIGSQIPSIVLFPSDKKQEKIEFKENIHTTRRIMEFVEQYGRSGIQLTEKSHLPMKFVKASDVQETSGYYDPRFDDI